MSSRAAEKFLAIWLCGGQQRSLLAWLVSGGLVRLRALPGDPVAVWARGGALAVHVCVVLVW